MKTFWFTILSIIGFLLIWLGDLRLMLTGIFLAIDVVGAQIYFSFKTLDERIEERLTQGLETTTNEIIIRMDDALQEILQNLKT